jgi:pyrroline-5-carboxylate reductase
MTRSEALAEILLVGCGKMGSALLSGWLQSARVGRIEIVEPHPPHLPEPIAARVHLHAAAETVDADWRPDVVVFAVKPQVIAGVVPGYRPIAAAGTLVLSIAAGKTIAGFEHLLGPAAIIRAMPNTPAAIGRGITVAVANSRASAGQKELAHRLLEAVGAVDWVEREDLLLCLPADRGVDRGGNCGRAPGFPRGTTGARNRRRFG